MRTLIVSFLMACFMSSVGFSQEKNERNDPEIHKKLNIAYHDLAYNFGTLNGKVVQLPVEVYISTQVQMSGIIDRCKREIAICQSICRTPMKTFPNGTPINVRSDAARDLRKKKNQAKIRMNKAKKELAEYTINPNSNRDVKLLEFHPLITKVVTSKQCGKFVFPLKVVQVVSEHEAIARFDLSKESDDSLAKILNVDEQWFWLQGWNTSDYADGDNIDDLTVIIEGTKKYQTVSGGSKTVWVAKPYTVKPYIAGITKSQFIDLLKRCQFTEDQFVKVWEKTKQENPDKFIALLVEAMPLKD